MNRIGIIAEYNPFHYGHVYQINKIKELYPDSIIIVIVSTTFTQRGEISLINKWDKTKICLEYGVSLVVELPTLYATQSADVFSYGALKILNSLEIDTLVFGSECNDVKLLMNLADMQLHDDKYNDLVKKYLDSGKNYPSAMSLALYDLSGIKIDKPNDLLGLSYVKEIIKNKYPITPVTIKRTNDYHGNIVNSNIVNASLIRKMISNNDDISSYVPSITLECINRDISYDNIYSYLIYNVIVNKDILNTYLTVDEGIENRIIKYINVSKNWNELVNNIKTKRYTYNKINRMLIHILLGYKKEYNANDMYIRVLGFNSEGRKYLNKIKKNITVYTNYKPNRSKMFDIEFQATCIYSLITRDFSLIEKEYKNKPIIK